MNKDLDSLRLKKRESPLVEIARLLIDYMFNSGSVQPGSRLPSERKLAEAFGIGRGTVREAIKSLSLLGLLEVRQGDGTYLRKPDSELLPQVIEWGLLLGEPKVIDLVEARAEIEKSLARLAATRRTEEDIAELESLLSKMEASFGDTTAFIDADVDFHLRLSRAARNTVLSDTLSSIQSLLRVWIARVIGTGAYQVTYNEHASIMAAVRHGDSMAATTAMTVHMERASSRLLETLKTESAKGASEPDDATSPTAR